MNGKVLPFPRRDRQEPPEDQHRTGKAICTACEREWAAVAPTGTVWLECPSCHAEKGIFKYPALPEGLEGLLVRQCHCGNQLFYLTEEGHCCPNCGVYQRYD